MIPKKEMLNIYIRKEIKEELEKNIAESLERYKKKYGGRVHANFNPEQYVIYITLSIDSNGIPISFNEYFVRKLTEPCIKDKNNKPIPFVFLTPITMMDGKFFACDNCMNVGNQRGYLGQFGNNQTYSFCTLCTEGQ